MAPSRITPEQARAELERRYASRYDDPEGASIDDPRVEYAADWLLAMTALRGRTPHADTRREIDATLARIEATLATRGTKQDLWNGLIKYLLVLDAILVPIGVATLWYATHGRS